MAILSPDTWQFICAHRTEDVRTLALQARKYPQVDMAAAVVQIAGWQIAEKKVPLWAQTEGVQYPAHLSMEQCSSEITARYKASWLQGDTMTDLTGGLGVDCSSWHEISGRWITWNARKCCVNWPAIISRCLVCHR